MMEVVVVGGGLAGCAVALALVDRGVAVNLVEAQLPGSAATGASAGMLAPQYEAEGPGAFFRVLLEARDYFPAFAERLEALARQSLHVRWDGMLVANFSEAEQAEAAAAVEWQRAAGQSAELVEPVEAAKIQPGVATDALTYLWLPAEGQVDSQRFPEAMTAALAAAGVRILKRSTAERVRSAQGRVEGLDLEDGRFLPADAVVIASGAWSGTIAGVPRAMPVRPVRGHIVRYAAPELRLRCLVAGHAGRYLVPREDGSVVAGSTMDESGFDRSVDDELVAVVHDAAGRLVPVIRTLHPRERWADLRPISRDGLPILGGDPEVAGLFYATGYGRNGILLAPLAGRVVAEMVCDGGVPAGWEGFLPARFTRD